MKAGIYIHIPFCKTKCSYCNFSFVINYPKTLPERYTSALIREIASCSDPPLETVDTIYLGGGTPSNVTAEIIDRILSACRAQFQIAEDSEITIEINPDTITPEKARQYRKLGVNRASLGAQSFNDAELRAVGRSHRANHILQAFEILRAEDFGNISLDLIIGLPRQTQDSWLNSLLQLRKLHPEHVSLYMLDLDRETRLGKDFDRGRTQLPDDELTSACFIDAISQLASDHYDHYEISNLALAGWESRHNLKYWMDAPYYGFGASSHSYVDGLRFKVEPDPERYIEQINLTGSAVVERTALSRERMRNEAFYLRLRRTEGVDLEAFDRIYHGSITDAHAEAIVRLTDAGLLIKEGGRLRLTPRGILLSNEVFQEFL
ncbi:MAG: radical SAM family heme chaperone HemW [Acidobacteria bacterium]|nr:radical SAM family heme chaperone HemW [Acidobacteriota bacterium]MBI3657811.1 radical SAM family heme chaperone HemW [Acidobacteriota bacterium]